MTWYSKIMTMFRSEWLTAYWQTSILSLLFFLILSLRLSSNITTFRKPWLAPSLGQLPLPCVLSVLGILYWGSDHTGMWVSIYMTHGRPQTHLHEMTQDPAQGWTHSPSSTIADELNLTLQSASNIHPMLPRLGSSPLSEQLQWGVGAVWLSWGTRKERQFTYSETLQTRRSILASWTHQTL